MIRRIDASHAVTALGEALVAAQDERWRRLDAQAATEPATKPAVTPRAPATAAKPATPAPGRASAKPAAARAAAKGAKGAPSPRPLEVPPGHLLLTPREVEALGHLFDLHPDLRG